MWQVDGVAYLLFSAKLLMLVVGFSFLISGLDDFFIDVCFGVRSLYRRCMILPHCAPLTEAALRTKEEQWIAVMIPAWDESAVIRPMLENSLRALDYRKFVIFVGTYHNDQATQAEVGQVCARHANVQRIVTPHDGPTNKADCLNWIHAGIRRYEKEQGITFQIFVMQDCEDVIHPLCYRLFNYLIPRKDMVQLPVQALPTKWHQFTAGHYLDEFAQSHYKDMVVREAVSGCIPAAGVGCGFSRHALDTIAAANRNQVFSIDSLTEDYDFGFRLHEHGMKQVFVRFSILRTITVRHPFTGKTVHRTRREQVCVSEYFPSRFKASVRQKSRWVLGITMQGWANLGWHGSLATRYMLFRDRKSIFTNLVNLLGYLLVLLVTTLWTIRQLDPDAYRYPSLLERDSVLWYVLFMNAFLLAIRIALRAYCVYQLYGLRQAALSMPRMIWGNLINFLATTRAIGQYLRYLRTGQLIKWDKTHHCYPSESELGAFRHKIGDLLLQSRRITLEQLTTALDMQRDQPRPLGEILASLGWVLPQEIEAHLKLQ